MTFWTSRRRHEQFFTHSPSVCSAAAALPLSTRSALFGFFVAGELSPPDEMLPGPRESMVPPDLGEGRDIPLVAVRATTKLDMYYDMTQTQV